MKNIFVTIAVLFPISITFAKEDNKTRLNVLLITADDLNCNSVGAYGCEVQNITPNIDRLAHEGIQFMNAHVASAVSQPSRGALATGRYPHCSGIEGFYHAEKPQVEIVEVLKKAGYYCGIVGKLEHSSPTFTTPWDYRKDFLDLGMGRDARIYKREVGVMIENARKEGKPFYLMVNSHDPHRPFYGSIEEQRMFGKKEIPQPSYVYTSDEVIVPGFLPDITGVRDEIVQYFNSVKRLDDTVGAVLKALEDSGERQNTIVIFLSDNGMSEPFSKTNCYYQSTRTPLIVYAPEQFVSEVVDTEHMISTVDFFPTIVDVLGLSVDADFDGTSFKPILEGKKQLYRTHVFTEFQSTSAKKTFIMRAVQGKRFTYIFNPWAIDSTIFQNEARGGMAFQAMEDIAILDKRIKDRVMMHDYRCIEEFYDLEKDPNSLVNLISHPAYKDTILHYRTLLKEHMKITDDPAMKALENKDDKDFLRLFNKDRQEYVWKRHEKNKK